MKAGSGFFLCESEASTTKAAHQTPQEALRESESAATKRSVRTEITPRFAKMTISLSQKQKGCIS
ncbi:hypothetical protein [Lysinibacillus sp. NPDC093216]|uniref:hypothetical protein n=1 Tax=Lysinibacillus sp. NPDC093216 TaxID=3390576 RepID=UPI003CFF57D2